MTKNVFILSVDPDALSPWLLLPIWLVLQLGTKPRTRQDRSIVPACLQERAPIRYEIRDENDWRICPTLGGYCLQRGSKYKLRFFSQTEIPTTWQLHMIAPRRLIDIGNGDMAGEHAREIGFQTLSFWTSEPLRRLLSQTANFEVRMKFDDGREPFHFAIPVIILAARTRLVFYILGCFLIAVLDASVQSKSVAD